MSFLGRLFGGPAPAHPVPTRGVNAASTPAPTSVPVPSGVTSAPAQPVSAPEPVREPPAPAPEPVAEPESVEPPAAEEPVNEPPAPEPMAKAPVESTEVAAPPSGGELTDAQAQAAGYRDAAEERAVEQDKSSTDSIQSSNQKACDCIQSMNYPGAEAALLACISRKEQFYGANDPNTIMSVENLAKVYVKMENWAKAEVQYERVLKAQRAESGGASVNTVATLNSLGFVRNKQGKHDAAEEAFIEAAKEKEALYPNDQSQLHSAYKNVAYTNCFQKKYSGAETYFNKSASIEDNDPSIKASVKATENIAYAQKMQKAVPTN